MIIIANYGVGNLASIQNMLNKIGVASKISSLSSDIEEAEKIILPGVGAFDTCAYKLKESGLQPFIHTRVIDHKIPLLGICVGMQLLTEGSEEGVMQGLGWIKGKIQRFRFGLNVPLKIPHMGWSETKALRDEPLFYKLTDHPRFYYVHSYHAQLEDPRQVLASAHYGYNFPSCIGMDNILGVQFHPEKSHKYGMQLLSNFSQLY